MGFGSEALGMVEFEEEEEEEFEIEFEKECEGVKEDGEVIA